MSLFFQDLQLFSLGRYIVAFRKTIQNSFKFMPFFSMICIGFFFAFKIGEKFNLERDVDDNIIYGTNSSSNFLRIITMMVGDLEIPGFDSTVDSTGTSDTFSDIFRLRNVYNTVIFLFFVFLMCIIILSLFEGIAVGEIKIVLDKANIEIISSSIIYVLKIQIISYTIFRILFKKKHKEPLFMSFKEVSHRAKIVTKKKSGESIKNIENNCNQMLIKLNTLSRKLDDQINQMKLIRKNITYK